MNHRYDSGVIFFFYKLIIASLSLFKRLLFQKGQTTKKNKNKNQNRLKSSPIS